MLLASCCRTENEQWSNRGVRESFTPVQLGHRACELQRQWAPTPTLLPPDAESPPATLYQRVMGPGDPFRLVDPCGSHSFSLSSKPVFRCVVPCHRAVVFQAPAGRLTHLQSSVSPMCFLKQSTSAIRLGWRPGNLGVHSGFSHIPPSSNIHSFEKYRPASACI